MRYRPRGERVSGETYESPVGSPGRFPDGERAEGAREGRDGRGEDERTGTSGEDSAVGRRRWRVRAVTMRG